MIPTAQNLGNIEADLKAYAPGLVDRDESAIEQALEILVRAYDPCISCSTHVIRLDREPSIPEGVAKSPKFRDLPWEFQ